MTRTLRRTHRRGQSLVELTFVLPLLLILVSAVLHFGIVYYVLIGVHSGVCNAALYAANHPTDTTSIYSVINQSMPVIVDTSSGNFVKHFYANAGTAFGATCTIRVTYDIAFLKSFPFGAFIPAPTLVSAVVSFPVLAN